MRLEALVSQIPPGRLAVDAIIRDAGGEASESTSFRSLFGMETVAVASPATSVVDHLDMLLDRIGPAYAALRPDIFIYVHAQPTCRRGALLAAPELRAHHPILSRLRYVIEVDQHNCAGVFFALRSIEQLFMAGFAR